MTGSQNGALTAPQPEHVIEWAVFIEEYREGKLTVEVSVLTDGQFTGAEAERIRQWAHQVSNDHIVELGKVIAMFSRADTLAIWVNIGLYDGATYHTPDGR
jgi:hypothetical protein